MLFKCPFLCVMCVKNVIRNKNKINKEITYLFQEVNKIKKGVWLLIKAQTQTLRSMRFLFMFQTKGVYQLIEGALERGPLGLGLDCWSLMKPLSVIAKREWSPIRFIKPVNLVSSGDSGTYKPITTPPILTTLHPLPIFTS